MDVLGRMLFADDLPYGGAMKMRRVKRELFVP